MQTLVEDRTISDNNFWYALRTKPNFEFIVNSQLEGHQVKTYFPCLEVSPVNPRSKTQKPYFPGYLFVKGELGQLYSKRIGLLRGVIGLVKFDGIPASISEGLIEVVRRQVVRENSNAHLDPTQLHRGDRVWINDPILQGFEAQFERCINAEERVAVLLSCMGRKVRFHVDADQVSKRAF
ncbi:MAG: transcription termination/antitermination NusG family protein [Anaerolineaceae bacterium]